MHALAVSAKQEAHPQSCGMVKASVRKLVQAVIPIMSLVMTQLAVVAARVVHNTSLQVILSLRSVAKIASIQPRITRRAIVIRDNDYHSCCLCCCATLG